MPIRLSTAVLLVAVLAGLPGVARAQGALLNVSAAAAVSEGKTSPTLGGGLTWRFNRALGMGVELSHVRRLPGNFPYIYCCDDQSHTKMTVFTTNVRLEIPTVSKRVVPFVIGGGGVASVSNTFNVAYATELALKPTVLPGPSDVTVASTNMALTLGGGASVMLTEHTALDADLRVLHVMGDAARNVGRFGGGVSFRF